MKEIYLLAMAIPMLRKKAILLAGPTSLSLQRAKEELIK